MMNATFNAAQLQQTTDSADDDAVTLQRLAYVMRAREPHKNFNDIGKYIEQVGHVASS